MTQDFSNGTFGVDMASPINFNIRSFSGTEKEDIILWLKEIRMYRQIFRWDGERNIHSSSRGNAHVWFSN